jgi:hypothetical protein
MDATVIRMDEWKRNHTPSLPAPNNKLEVSFWGPAQPFGWFSPKLYFIQLLI